MRARSKVIKGIEVGKTYVVEIKDSNNIELLHEYSKKEKFVHQIYPMLITTIKALSVLISVAIPPLLLITIPLLKKKQNED